MMDINKIKNIIKQKQSETTGVFSVIFQDMETKERCAVNAEAVVPTASVYKYFTLAELYRQSEEGTLSLTDRIRLTDDMTIGSGVLRNLTPGADLSLYDYAMLMMNLSDNTAADMLYRRVGKENIYENILKPLGMTRTKADFTCQEMLPKYMGYPLEKGETSEHYFGKSHPSCRNGRYFTCQEAENTETTAEDMRKFLAALYEGKLVSEHACQEMLAILKKCQTNSRIPRYLPGSVEVAHKTGTVDRVANDAGIIYTEKGNYILILFYNGNLADEEEYDRNAKGLWGDDFLAEISAEIYKAYMN